MLRFKRLSFKNFLGYGNEEQEYNLDGNEIVLIAGHNGAGKSVMVDALFYALYGRPYRKVKLSSLVNRTNKRGLRVSLTFSSGNDEFEIIRTIKPNSVSISKNGEILPNYKSNDMQSDFVENVLGFTEKVFRQIVVLGSTYHVPFMRLPLAQKREMLESIFDLEDIDGVKKKVREYKTELDSKLIENEREIALITGKIRELDEQIEKIRLFNAQKKEEFARVIRDKKDDVVSRVEKLKLLKEEYSQEEVDRLEVMLIHLRDKRNGLRPDLLQDLRLSLSNSQMNITKYKRDIDDARKEFQSGWEVYQQFMRKYNAFQSDRESITFANLERYVYSTVLGGCLDEYYQKTTSEISDMKTRGQELKFSLKTAQNKLDYYTNHDVCSECGSSLSGPAFDDIKASLTNEIADLTGKIEVIVADLRQMQEGCCVEVVKTFSEKLDSQLQVFVEKGMSENSVFVPSTDLTRLIDREKENCQKYEEEMRVLEDSFNASVKEIEIEVSKINEQLSRLKRKQNLIEQIHHSIQADNKNIAEMEQAGPHVVPDVDMVEKLKSYRETLSEKQGMNEKIKRYQGILALFLNDILADTGFRAYIISQYVELFNERVNLMLQAFEADYQVRFTESFDVNILYRGEEEEYDSFSGGERQRIDMAILFTFIEFVSTKSKTSSNMIVFDEVLDSSLDEDGVDSLFNILRSVMSSGKMIYLISHRNTNYDRATKVIEVKKRNQFSEATVVF